MQYEDQDVHQTEMAITTFKALKLRGDEVGRVVTKDFGFVCIGLNVLSMLLCLYCLNFSRPH